MSAPVAFPIGGDSNLLRFTERENYHLLEFTSPPDNRLTPDFIAAFIEGLTYIQTEREPKVLVTTSSIPKFYSNGLNLELAMETPGFFPDSYYALMRTLIEFPWPTVAWVNGHGFAAGFTTSVCHDYIVMNPDRGFLCMNELEFGAPLPAPMLSIFKERFGFRLAHKIALEAHRFSGKEALQEGIVTKLGALPEVEELVASISKWAVAPSYQAIRKELFRHVVDDLNSYYTELGRMVTSNERESAYYHWIVKNYRSKL